MAENLMNKDHKVVSDLYRKNYESITWKGKADDGRTKQKTEGTQQKVQAT